MGEKSGRNSQDERWKHLDIETVNAASATDFTGLIPANPQQAEAQDAYESIHTFGNKALDKGRENGYTDK